MTLSKFYTISRFYIIHVTIVQRPNINYLDDSVNCYIETKFKGMGANFEKCFESKF